MGCVLTCVFESKLVPTDIRSRKMATPLEPSAALSRPTPPRARGTPRDRLPHRSRPPRPRTFRPAHRRHLRTAGIDPAAHKRNPRRPRPHAVHAPPAARPSAPCPPGWHASRGAFVASPVLSTHAARVQSSSGGFPVNPSVAAGGGSKVVCE
ncbi:hypothetical protein PVAP13_1KG510513 [Panicum virgatum]|uniref:Uncharacterized protein n=1 Tax=Panicum virgatum TaxID=38727 RepID=A0A8T0XRD1_PANVG|nr:hypothetical protein PVAP13_1KG510513 [Panicum virgatum]